MPKAKDGVKKVSVNKVTTNEKSDYTKLTDYIQAIYLKRGIDDPPWALLMTQVRNIIMSLFIFSLVGIALHIHLPAPTSCEG